MDINVYLLQRYNVLKVFVYTCMIICFIFNFINFMQGRTFLAIIDVCIFFISLIILLNFQKIITSKYRETFVVSYSILMLITLIFLFWGGSVQNLSYIWMVLIPFIGYMTNSFKNGFRLTAFFLISSIGIYLYNTQIKAHVPNPTNYVQVFNVIVLIVNVWALIHMYEKIRLNITDKLIELTTTDHLTKLKNRSEFYKTYKNYKNVPVCLILLDIEALKAINDEYGHLAGDVALMSIAKIITNNQSDKDCIFRMGNDEFAILIANTSCEDCLTMAKNIFAEVSECKTIFKNDVIPLRVNIALAEIYADGNNADELMAKADKLLRQAKKSETDKIALA